MLQRIIAVLIVVFSAFTLSAQAIQEPAKTTLPPATTQTPLKWYDKISLRGYAQMRYNRLAETNENLKCEQCDKGIGKGQTFEFRRARLVLSGNPHERFSIYIQFDFSVDASATSKHYLQVRDAYFDYAFDKKKEFRVRFGQSKVPFCFENLQSSSNRLAFDRNDALNSAAANERDFGTFLMWAPHKSRETFKKLTEEGLKGSGDYGVVTFGVYNGQTANKPELNDNLHKVGRIAYPITIGKQIIEPGIFAYTGKFTLDKTQVTTGAKTKADLTYLDERIGGQFVLYPQPFGVQAEYNVGKGPQYNGADSTIAVKKLKGGYVMVNYRTKIGHGHIQPYVRYHWYEGGKKQETDARLNKVKETNIGVEWQPAKYLELTLEYVIGHRITQDYKVQGYDERGKFLRIQAQANF